MRKSTVSAAPSKYTKPRPDFPLFPHASGRWCKKVRQKFEYFGKVADDPKGVAALNLWNDQKDELLAGRRPRVQKDGLTVKALANEFLNAKKQKLVSGELSPRTYRDYHTAAAIVVDHFGRGRLVEDVRPAEFTELRGKLAKTRGPVALGNIVRLVRILFRYAGDAELIEKPVRFGPDFREPAKKVLRKERQSRGVRMFEPAELRLILDHLAGKPVKIVREGKKVKVEGKRNPALRAMVLLGLNCAYGQSDCAALPRSALDLKAGWVDYPRVKTAVERRCPLWKETVAALKEALAARPEPKDPADADLVFVTRFGVRWVRMQLKDEEKSLWTGIDSVGLEFGKVLRALDLKKRGIQFYTLRHVHQTVGDEAKDPVAVSALMGHVDGTMAGRYREAISDKRLQAVVRHVHKWLFASK